MQEKKRMFSGISFHWLVLRGLFNSNCDDFKNKRVKIHCKKCKQMSL